MLLSPLFERNPNPTMYVTLTLIWVVQEKERIFSTRGASPISAMIFIWSYPNPNLELTLILVLG